MKISRIWGVRGSQCCRFQQVTLSNIKCAQVLSLSLKTLLGTKKTFKTEKIYPFWAIFPLIFNYQGMKK